MVRLFSEKTSRWLLPLVVVLLVLQVLTLPLMLGFTYAGRSETPDHILTYSENKLTWDSATNIDGNGVGGGGAVESKQIAPNKNEYLLTQIFLCHS